MMKSGDSQHIKLKSEIEKGKLNATLAETVAKSMALAQSLPLGALLIPPRACCCWSEKKMWQRRASSANEPYEAPPFSSGELGAGRSRSGRQPFHPIPPRTHPYDTMQPS